MVTPVSFILGSLPFLEVLKVVVGRRLSYRPVSVRIFGKEPPRAECSHCGKATWGFRSGEGYRPLICAIAQSLADICCHGSRARRAVSCGYAAEQAQAVRGGVIERRF